VKVNHEAVIMLKARELIKQLHINLQHFPRHEKYALCQQIRNSAYGVFGGLIECHKKYHNKTSLTKLDIDHERLRAFINLAFELGYFQYKDSKKERTESEALRRYTAVSILVNELGAMLGGWIRSLSNKDGGL
jgi:four helix bundle protein